MQPANIPGMSYSRSAPASINKASSTLSVGQFLRAARDGLGLSRYQVATPLGVREQYIAGIESGEWAMSPTLIAYADFLAQRMGEGWLSEFTEALEARFLERQRRARPAERLAMVDRALRAQEGRRVQAKAKADRRQPTLSQMAAEAPDKMERPAASRRSSAGRAAVLPTASGVGSNIVQIAALIKRRGFSQLAGTVAAAG